MSGRTGSLSLTPFMFWTLGLWQRMFFLQVILASQDTVCRSDVNHSVSEWTLADLTDVTLVSEENSLMKMIKICLVIKVI